MNHRGAMLKIAAGADHSGLGVGAQLFRICAQGCERRFGQRSAELDRIIDQRFEVGAGYLAGEWILEHRCDRDAPQRGDGGRAIFAVDLLDEGNGLADGHDVLAMVDRTFQIRRLALYCFSARRTLPYADRLMSLRINRAAQANSSAPSVVVTAADNSE